MCRRLLYGVRINNSLPKLIRVIRCKIKIHRILIGKTVKCKKIIRFCRFLWVFNVTFHHGTLTKTICPLTDFCFVGKNFLKSLAPASTRTASSRKRISAAVLERERPS